MRLQEFDLFRDAAPHTLATLAHACRCQRLDGGALVCAAGEPQAPLILVCEGALRVYQADQDGREQTMALVHRGQVANLLGALVADGRAPANVAAWGATAAVLLIPSAAFALAAAHDAGLALAVMRQLAAMVLHLNALVTDLSLRSVRQRLARFLLEHAQAASAGQSVLVRSQWTHAQIALQLGTAREVVSRQLRAFVEEGVVAQRRQQIIVRDPSALRRIAEG